MEKKLLKILISLFLFSLIPLIAKAATTTTLEKILDKLADWLIKLGALVAIIFIIVGGYKMITSAGDPKEFETGKKALLYAAIGLVVILIAKAIVSFIQNIVSGG